MNTALKSIPQAPTLESLAITIEALTNKLNSTSAHVEALSKQANSTTMVVNNLSGKLAQLNHRLPGLIDPLVIAK